MSETQRSVTVTVKSGTDYDAWWAVFRGATYEVYDDLSAFFGFDSESVTNLNLHELVSEASKLAQGTALITRELGATPLPAPLPAAEGDPWAAASQSAPSPGPASAQGAAAALLEQVAACTTTDELKRLWASNQGAFDDQAVMDAWKARGRALKRAA
ncbi:hypothetical protein [Streptomyces sp. DT117]|uniref:hypothetical protein n=1 Tax=Streptomyces sp. DT117 TaxID=3393422 RepID=UPI003CEA68BC